MGAWGSCMGMGMPGGGMGGRMGAGMPEGRVKGTGIPMGRPDPTPVTGIPTGT